MAADHIDFWFTIGSSYSELQQSNGVQFRRRPFHLLMIFRDMKHRSVRGQASD